MLKLRTPRERTKRARRYGRSVAALITTSLVAPAAIASVATTVATTYTASPAAAAAPRNYVVAGDDPARTGAGSGAWGFHGDDYSRLRSIITDPTLFGPDGTVKARFTIGSPISTISAASLAGVDVFFSGAIQGASGSSQSYSPAEQQALRDFVQGGGIVIINQNSPTWATGEAFGVTEQSPEAIFEEFSGHTGLNGGFEAPYIPTIGATPTSGAGRPVASTPLIAGHFGTVTSYSLWHTVAGFNSGSLPSGAVVNANVLSRCDIAQLSCADPTTPPQATTTTAVGAPTTTVDPNPPLPYRNDLNNLPSLVTVAPGQSSTGQGALILTSDVDTYSNHAEYNGGTMMAGNELLAKNTFGWIGDLLNARNPVDGFTAVTPTRWLDTRSGAPLAEGGKLAVTMAGTSNGGVSIPANATGVVLNVTATQPTGVESYLTVYPTPADPAATPPNSSNLNFRAGNDVANAVTVTLGDGGRVSFYNNKGTTHLLIDVVGYFQPATGKRLTSTSPSRVLDTRNAIGSVRSPIGEGESRVVQITGGVVPTGASAVVLNVTASEGTRGGYVSVVPGDQPAEPTTSSVNFTPNTIKANLVVVPLAADGTIRVFNKFGTTAVIADVLGYYSDNGGTFAQLTPARLLDTRNGIGVAKAPLGSNTSLEFDVRGQGGVPAIARTVILNVTAASPTDTSYLTVYPEANARPEASNLNFTAGAVVPNLVVANIGADGKVRVYNNLGTVDVIADVVAWFN